MMDDKTHFPYNNYNIEPIPRVRARWEIPGRMDSTGAYPDSSIFDRSRVYDQNELGIQRENVKKRKFSPWCFYCLVPSVIVILIGIAVGLYFLIEYFLNQTEIVSEFNSTISPTTDTTETETGISE